MREEADVRHWREGRWPRRRRYLRGARALWLRVCELEQALRLTQEHVGVEALPRLPGWSWWDAIGCPDCGEAHAVMFATTGKVTCWDCGSTRRPDPNTESVAR